jgi:ATP-dependent Lon protease
VTYVRANSDTFGFGEAEFDKIDIHIHLPEGAVAKDGPSAGVTLVTALVSELKGVPVRRDVGMTGEITLHGRVLTVGGLKEKILAAHRAGLRKILIPKKNAVDVIEIPARVTQDIHIIGVERVKQVLDHALVDPASAEQPGQATETSTDTA